MGHSSKSNGTKHSSKSSKKDTMYISSSKPSSSTRPTPLEQYLGSGEPHERVALGLNGGRQSGDQMAQQFDSAWRDASGGR